MILKNVSNKLYNNIPQRKLLYYWDELDKKHFFSKEYRNEFTANRTCETKIRWANVGHHKCPRKFFWQCRATWVLDGQMLCLKSHHASHLPSNRTKAHFKYEYDLTQITRIVAVFWLFTINHAYAFRIGWDSLFWAFRPFLPHPC